MRFHGYIERAFGSRAKVRILEVLFTNPDGEFTGRELAREIDFTPARAHSILKELVSENLVKMRRKGRSYLFSLNKDSFLAEKLSYIFSVGHLPLRKLEDIISSRVSKKHIVSIVLFGSIAHREEKPDSDIDLFCIVNDEVDKENVRKRLLELNDLTIRLFGNSVSPTISTISEFRRNFKKGEALVKEILRESVLLYGKPLSDIVTKMS